MIDQINDPTDPLGPTRYELWADFGPLDTAARPIAPTPRVTVWVCRGSDKPWRLGTYASAEAARAAITEWIGTWHAAHQAALRKRRDAPQGW